MISQSVFMFRATISHELFLKLFFYVAYLISRHETLIGSLQFFPKNLFLPAIPNVLAGEHPEQKVRPGFHR